jgi:hypothetical protein
MRNLCAMILHTSRVVMCGLTGNVLVNNEPFVSSGTTTLSTDLSSFSGS